jgi:hypothetical protein
MSIKNSILQKVREKEFEQRCIKVAICPKCGEDLKLYNVFHLNSLNKSSRGCHEGKCNKCNKIYIIH